MVVNSSKRKQPEPGDKRKSSSETLPTNCLKVAFDPQSPEALKKRATDSSMGPPSLPKASRSQDFGQKKVRGNERQLQLGCNTILRFHLIFEYLRLQSDLLLKSQNRLLLSSLRLYLRSLRSQLWPNLRIPCQAGQDHHGFRQRRDLREQYETNL
ncbi:hypothetical protein N7507_002886 [Penicillium longicatenatum]|nr:hypothetical protein N7507_002886 [Penicillium longicatenatum]